MAKYEITSSEGIELIDNSISEDAAYEVMGTVTISGKEYKIARILEFAVFEVKEDNTAEPVIDEDLIDEVWETAQLGFDILDE